MIQRWLWQESTISGQQSPNKDKIYTNKCKMAKDHKDFRTRASCCIIYSTSIYQLMLLQFNHQFLRWETELQRNWLHYLMGKQRKKIKKLRPFHYTSSFFLIYIMWPLNVFHSHVSHITLKKKKQPWTFWLHD